MLARSQQRRGMPERMHFPHCMMCFCCVAAKSACWVFFSTCCRSDEIILMFSKQSNDQCLGLVLSILCSFSTSCDGNQLLQPSSGNVDVYRHGALEFPSRFVHHLYSYPCTQKHGRMLHILCVMYSVQSSISVELQSHKGIGSLPLFPPKCINTQSSSHKHSGTHTHTLTVNACEHRRDL